MIERTYIETMHIALLGGSFNPPQRGHQALVKSLSASKKFDEIWIIPCLAHPFEKKLAPYEDRMEMIRLTFEALAPHVKVLNTEEQIQNNDGYSVVMLEHLKKQYPEYHFYFVMGSDLLLEKDKWKDFDKIEKMVTLYPIPRAGYENSPFPQISSTQIREKLMKGESIVNLVPPDVEKYIHQKGLYS